MVHGSWGHHGFIAKIPPSCDAVSLRRHLLLLLPALIDADVSIDIERGSNGAEAEFVVGVAEPGAANWAVVSDVLEAYGLRLSHRAPLAGAQGTLVLGRQAVGTTPDIVREMAISIDRRSLFLGTKTGRVLQTALGGTSASLLLREPFKDSSDANPAVRALCEIPTVIGPLLLIGREGGVLDFAGAGTAKTVLRALTVEPELSWSDAEHYNRGHQITLITMVAPDLVAVASTRGRTFLFRPSRIESPDEARHVIEAAHEAAPSLETSPLYDLRSIFRRRGQGTENAVVCVSRGGTVRPSFIDADDALRPSEADASDTTLSVGYVSQLDVLRHGNVAHGELPLRISLATDRGLLLGRVSDRVTWEEVPIDALAVGSLWRSSDAWTAISGINGRTSIFLSTDGARDGVRRRIGSPAAAFQERAPLLSLGWIPPPWGESSSGVLRLVSVAGDNSITLREFEQRTDGVSVERDGSLEALSDTIEETACSLEVHQLASLLQRLAPADVLSRIEKVHSIPPLPNKTMHRALALRQLACVLAGAILIFPKEERTDLLRIALEFLWRLRRYAKVVAANQDVGRELTGRINQAIRLMRKRVLFASPASMGSFRGWSTYLSRAPWGAEEMVEVAHFASQRFTVENLPRAERPPSATTTTTRSGKIVIDTHQVGDNSTHNFDVSAFLRAGEVVTQSVTTPFLEGPKDFLGVVYGTSHGRVRWYPPSPEVKDIETSDLSEEDTAASIGIAIGDLGNAIKWILRYPRTQAENEIFIVAASDHGQIGCWLGTYRPPWRLKTRALWYSVEESGIVGLGRGRVQGQDCIICANGDGDVILFDQGCLGASPMRLPGRRIDRLRTGLRPRAMALIESSGIGDVVVELISTDDDRRVRVRPLLCRGSEERTEKLPALAEKFLESFVADVPSRLRETAAEVTRVKSARSMLVKLCFWLAERSDGDATDASRVKRRRVRISDVPYALQDVLLAARQISELNDKSDLADIGDRLRRVGRLFRRLQDWEALETLFESLLVLVNHDLVVKGHLNAANSLIDVVEQMRDEHQISARRLTLRIIKSIIEGYSLSALLTFISSGDPSLEAQARELFRRRARLLNSALLDPDSVLTLEATRAATAALFECALRLDREGIFIDDVDLFDGFLEAAFRLSSGIQEERGHRGILLRELARAFALTARICRKRIVACGLKAVLRDFDIDFRLAIAAEMSTLGLFGIGLREDEIARFRSSSGIRTASGEDRPFQLSLATLNGSKGEIADSGQPVGKERQGADPTAEPERTGTLSWLLIDEALDWLQKLERSLYDEPRRLAQQLIELDAHARRFRLFLDRERAFDDPFRRTNRFLEKALGDLSTEVHRWEDGEQLQPDELPRVLEFVVDILGPWARRWRNRLRAESQTRHGTGLRSPITELIGGVFLRIEGASTWFPRGAAVQREVLLAYLNHGAVESVHESNLALYELATFIARESGDYETAMRRRVFDRASVQDALSERSGASLDPELDAVLRMLALNDHVPDSMRDLRTMLVYLRQLPLANRTRVDLRSWLEGMDRFDDCSFIERERTYLSRAHLSYVCMAVAEFSRNNRRYGLSGDRKIRVEMALTSIVLESKFDASDAQVRERVELLWRNQGLRRLPPDPRRPRRSHGLGIHLLKLVGVATGWTVDFARRVQGDRGTLVMTLRPPPTDPSESEIADGLGAHPAWQAEGLLVFDDSIVFAQQLANLLFALGRSPYSPSEVTATSEGMEFWEIAAPRRRFMVHLNPGVHQDPCRALIALARRFGRPGNWVNLRVLIDTHVPEGPSSDDLRQALEHEEVKEAFLARCMRVSAYDDLVPPKAYQPDDMTPEGITLPKDIMLVQRLRREVFGHELQDAARSEVKHDVIPIDVTPFASGTR